jgi:hypothetical protein
VVQRALEAAAERLFRETRGASSGDVMAEDRTPAQRRADALALLAESALAANFDGGTAGDRYQVVLHVEAGDTASDGPTSESTGRLAGEVRVRGSAGAGDGPCDGALEVGHGAV